MSADDESPDEVMEALNEFFRHLGDWSYGELVSYLGSLEARFSASLSPEELVELRRRVAEDTLLAAQVKGLPVEECERQLQSVEALGWTNLYRKWSVLFALGRYCRDAARGDVARRLLQPMEAELLAGLSGGEAWCAEALAALRARLYEIG